MLLDLFVGTLRDLLKMFGSIVIYWNKTATKVAPISDDVFKTQS